MSYSKICSFGMVMIIVLIIGCATGERMKQLDAGMTKDEVVDILGRPDGYKQEGKYEALKYSHRLVSGWSWDRADYYVILRNGKVLEYGTGEIRVKEHMGGNILFLVPLK